MPAAGVALADGSASALSGGEAIGRVAAAAEKMCGASWPLLLSHALLGGASASAATWYGNLLLLVGALPWVLGEWFHVSLLFHSSRSLLYSLQPLIMNASSSADLQALVELIVSQSVRVDTMDLLDGVLGVSASLFLGLVDHGAALVVIIVASYLEFSSLVVYQRRSNVYAFFCCTRRLRAIGLIGDVNSLTIGSTNKPLLALNISISSPRPLPLSTSSTATLSFIRSLNGLPQLRGVQTRRRLIIIESLIINSQAH